MWGSVTNKQGAITPRNMGVNERMNAKQRMIERITRHGENLLAIFPNATEQDPIKLCKRLRRWEAKATRATTAYCNGDVSECAVETSYIVQKVRALLGLKASDKRVFVNQDPRGYALKIDDAWTRDNAPALHRDWGGYGIIAPDLTND